MSFDTLKAQSQRELCVIFELDLDINDPSLDAEFALNPSSYGTPKTTNDIRAYKQGEFRTYRYSNQRIVNLDCFPYLTDAKSNAPKANPSIDIGFRASANITLKDFISSDAFELTGLYADRRVSGAHWAKLFARNFIKNRPARIKRGYLVNGVYDAANFNVEHYIVDEYQNPTLSGNVTFSLVDVLALTNGINAKAPETSNATLNAALTTASTNATITLESGLTAAEITAKFGANGATGTLAIDSEYIGYTVTSATGIAPVVVSLTTRGSFGTVVADHAINTTVQKCLAWPSLTNIIDIIDEILRDYTDIDESYIPSAEWAALKAGDLSGFMLKNCIAKETEVKKLLNELIQIAGLTMYVDVVERKIKITATPNFDQPVITFNQVEHLELGTLQVKNKFDKLITRQLVSWAPLNYSSTDQQNYAKTFRVAAILEEDKSRLGTKNAGNDVVSRWLPNTPDGNQIATGIAQRNVARYSQVPVEVSFEVDSKYIGTITGGRLWLGSVFDIETVNNVYCNGAFQPEVLTCQCTSVVATSRADKWRVTGISYKANVPPNADYYIPAGEYFNYILADNFDFIESREYIVVISQGAVFGSTSTAWAAFRQGTFAAGATLKIINQAQIVGAGGVGGDGGSAATELGVCAAANGLLGAVGGPAASFTTNTVIDNTYGLIGGGGGGGKGGNAFCDGTTPVAGGGGGGGQGSAGGVGGAGGISDPGADASNGANGSINYPGAGGAGAGFSGNAGFTGGGLGNLASSIVAAGGAAILKNGNTVTITGGNNSEQVRGAII
jgi:hypothetical protein